jgi:hypothetical protein
MYGHPNIAGVNGLGHLQRTREQRARELLPWGRDGRPGPTGRTVVIADDRAIGERELHERVAARRTELDLADRSLVVLGGTNGLEWVITYLALLADDHVPLLGGARPDRIDDLAARWRPAATVTIHGDTVDGDTVEVHRRASATSELHPDLALLLATSGSTGDAKLVRLSHANVMSNAGAIAEFLGLGPDDRGITSLPLHYTYGLSVLHSHLAAGASIVLAEASVVDPCFRAALDRHDVTNVAGVPHTFDLLDRAGPELLRVPSLRFVTQAGGRMEPDKVAEWAERTRRWGVDFYPMYGQTEATARMAYLPPGDAARHPAAVGRPIPGGEIEIRPLDELPDTMPAGTGEVVYRGPNVMLGYAHAPADLALGATLDDLRTGDLGRIDPATGYLHIVGRRSQFVKPFGVRVDLGALERALAEQLGPVALAGDDDHLVLAAPDADAVTARATLAGLVDLPRSRITIAGVASLPRTSAGKIDTGTLLADHPFRPAATTRSRGSDGDDPGATIAAIYASVLGRPDVDEMDSFVSLGGDSLGYVECSVRLEHVLGQLPPDWHVRSIGDLVHAADTATGRRDRSPAARLDTTVALRAIGICLVVATHMRFWYFPGGAHLLLAVVGFNLSRFLLPIDDPGARWRAGLRTIGRVALPTMTWAAIGLATGASWGLATVLLVNNYAGVGHHDGDHWHFWFIEVFTQITLAALAVLAVPALRRLERRFTWHFPLALLACAVLLRLDWFQFGSWYNQRYRTHAIAWFFVLGWLIERSDTRGRRAVTSVLALVLMYDVFRYPPREWFIGLALLALIWAREIPVPRLLVRPLGVVAAASMWILISHFTFWPPLTATLPIGLAYVGTIAGGVAVWAASRAVTSAVRRVDRDVLVTRFGRKLPIVRIT